MQNGYNWIIFDHLETIMSYYDLPTGNIESKTLVLEYLEQAGPRIVRLIYKPSDYNLLAEIPDAKLESPWGEYSIHGGHRLWAAPESPEFTYIPDDLGLIVEKSQYRVVLTGAIEVPTGLQKKIEIILNEDHPEVQLNHILTNMGTKPISCAAWSITVLPPGGLATLPLRTKPESDLLPDRHISFWPYSNISDPRLKLSNDELCIQATSLKDIFKVGARCPQGWINYTNRGLCFRKEFEFNAHAEYCDMGCNAEIYTNGTIIETEALSELVLLSPGESIRHNEKWLVYESQ